MKINSQHLARDLMDYTGTENWMRHSLNPTLLYTDGAEFFADQAGAYWLLDILATQPEILQTMKDGFASIKLIVKDDSTGELVCDDGNGNVTYRRALDFTDAPVGTWTFFMVNNVIMVPSEY